MPKWVYALLAIVAIGCMFAGARMVKSDVATPCWKDCTRAACEADYHCPFCACVGGICQ